MVARWRRIRGAPGASLAGAGVGAEGWGAGGLVELADSTVAAAGVAGNVAVWLAASTVGASLAMAGLASPRSGCFLGGSCGP